MGTHDYSWGSPIKDPKANLILAFLDFGVLAILIVKFPGWSFFFTKVKVTSHFIAMHRVNQKSMAMNAQHGLSNYIRVQEKKGISRW